MKVKDLMSTELITLAPEENINLAEEIMRLGRIRHLPVADGQRMVGLITHRDLLRAQISVLADISRDEKRDIQHHIRAKDIMNKEVTTVAPDTSALEAATLLKKHKYGCLPVVDNGLLVGIITEADFLQLVIGALQKNLT